MIPGITASRRRAVQPPGGNDPYWSNVVLLMHFEDSIADQKGGNYSAAGTTGYAAGRFGRCLQLSTGDSGVVEPAVTTAMDLPGDFTIEGWMKPDAGSSGSFINRFDVGPLGIGWQMYLESNGRMSFYQYSSSGGSYPIRAVGPDVRDGQWHHVAVTRQGSVLRLFVEGVQVGTGESSVNYTSSVARLSVGYQVQGNSRYPMRGGIEDVRITKDVARYTANFTPPAAAFPNS